MLGAQLTLPDYITRLQTEIARLDHFKTLHMQLNATAMH